MANCALVDGNGFLKVVSETTCTEFILMRQSELDLLQSGSLAQLQELLTELFLFDPVVFGVVEGALISAFLTSHFTGRVVRFLGKS